MDTNFFVIVQSIEKTSEYQRRCFESIGPTVEENNSLKAQVAHLSKKLEGAEADRATLTAERSRLIEEVGRLEREKQGT